MKYWRFFDISPFISTLENTIPSPASPAHFSRSVYQSSRVSTQRLTALLRQVSKNSPPNRTYTSQRIRLSRNQSRFQTFQYILWIPHDASCTFPSFALGDFLPPFAMYKAFPCSDYYGGSVAMSDIQKLLS